MHRHYNLINALKGDLNELYLSMAIRSFAISMIGIFIPIYLLSVGYSLQTIFIFYALVFFAHTLFIIPSAKLGSKFGFKHVISISVPLMILFLLLLITLETHKLQIYYLAILLGIKNSLLWTGYHTIFSKFSHRKKRGTEIAKERIFRAMSTAIGPIIGGIFLTFFGFKFLFIGISILLGISIIPLLLSKDIHKTTNFRVKEIFHKRKKRDIAGFVGEGIETVTNTYIWPVFLFLFILGNSYFKLGMIYTISLLFSVLFMYLIGKFSDIKRRLVLKIGSILTSITWLIRTIIKTLSQVLLIDALYGMVRNMASVPFQALTYDKSKKKIKYILFREITINFSVTIFFFVMALIGNLKVSLFIASLASLLFLFF